MQKKILIFLGFILFLSMIGLDLNLVACHAPSNMNLSYNLSSQILSVEITHNVDDPDVHYISTLEIAKNGWNFYTLTTGRQPAASTFTYNITVETKNGDVLTAIAKCRFGESLSKSITIKGYPLPLDSIINTLLGITGIAVSIIFSIYLVFQGLNTVKPIMKIK
jgi:hypothetical protein